MTALFHTCTLWEHLQVYILGAKLSTINKSTPLYSDTNELNKQNEQFYGVLRLSCPYRAERHKI